MTAVAAAAPSVSSRSAAPVTRSTPRNSPPGWEQAAGRSWPTARTRASSWSTPVVSSRRRSTKPSSSSSGRPKGAKVVRSAVWPNGTASSWPRRCPKLRSSASTTTARSGTGSTTSRRPPMFRTPPGTAVGCSLSARPPAPPAVPGPAPRRPGLAPRRPRPPLRRPGSNLRGPARSTVGPGAPPSGPRTLRRRLSNRVRGAVKIASGCDRRCSFCAIPSFRGAYLSRRPKEVLAEAGWLAGEGVRELDLVSENSTSYGKDLGNLRLWRSYCPRWRRPPGLPGSGSATCSRLRVGPLSSRSSPAPGGRGVLRLVLPARQWPAAARDA